MITKNDSRNENDEILLLSLLKVETLKQQQQQQ